MTAENTRRLRNLYSICVNTCAGLKRLYLKTLGGASKTNGKAKRNGVGLTDDEETPPRGTQPKCDHVETATHHVVTL